MVLNSQQYNTIMREYDERRLHNKEELLKRFALIYEAVPEIKQIDDQIAKNSIARGRALLQNNDPSVLETLSADNLELSMRKIELLVAAGYPKDFLEPVYTCQKCKDTGYIEDKKCSCFEQSIVDIMYSQSGIRERLTVENFSHFSFDYYSEKELLPNRPSPRANMISLVEQCRQFIRDFDQKPGNFLFQGNTGVGKTFLTNCIAKELLDTGHTVVYLTAFQLFDLFEKYTFKKTNTSTDALQYILNCSLLIIDDLGTELNNSFTTSQLFLCINERLLNNHSTIISTNLSLSDLTSAYSERIVSRVVENYHIFNIYGDDIRMMKALKGY